MGGLNPYPSVLDCGLENGKLFTPHGGLPWGVGGGPQMDYHSLHGVSIGVEVSDEQIHMEVGVVVAWTQDQLAWQLLGTLGASYILLYATCLLRVGE